MCFLLSTLDRGPKGPIASIGNTVKIQKGDRLVTMRYLHLTSKLFFRRICPLGHTHFQSTVGWMQASPVTYRRICCEVCTWTGMSSYSGTLALRTRHFLNTGTLKHLKMSASDPLFFELRAVMHAVLQLLLGHQYVRSPVIVILYSKLLWAQAKA